MILFTKKLVKYILTAMGKKTVCCVSCLWLERHTDFSHCTCVDEKPMVGKMTSILQGCYEGLLLYGECRWDVILLGSGGGTSTRYVVTKLV